VSLNGSLDGFALPDVLVLLSTTKKTGELRVWGERTEGSVWLDAGLVVAAYTNETQEIVEAVTDLLRLRGGGFSFDIRDPEGKGTPVAMEAVLGEAQNLMDEWRKIEEVVSSADLAVRLVDEPPTSQVIVKATQWKVLVHLAAAPGSTVNQMRSQLKMSELGCARAVKELVESGLARVGEPEANGLGGTASGDDLERVWATARRLSAPDEEAEAGVVDFPAKGEAPAPQPQPQPQTAAQSEPATAGNGNGNGAAAGDGAAEAINRDVLLKFISSSRG
jgi:hypothetical protein